MLSFEERELARQFRELGARIVVPRAAPQRGRAGIPLLALLVALAAIAIVVAIVARGDDSWNTASPPSPRESRPASPSGTAGVVASPTPSHRATPYGGLPSQILPPPGTTHSVTGTITELGADGLQHPVTGARIDVWVDLPSGTGYHWMSDVTDASGRYELWGIPAGATATLYAGTAATLQPCAHQTRMDGDASLDIEVVPVAGGSAAVRAAVGRWYDAQRLGRVPLIISGQAFERAADGGRIPVPDARVWIGGDMEPLIATTVTDAQGGYALCGLDRLTHEFAATAPGYRDSNAITWVDADSLMHVDLEMSR